MTELGSIDGLVGQAYQSVKTFNLIANNIGNQTKLSLKERLLNQIKIIQSELDELKAGVEENNPLEVFDGGCDLVVTAFGALQMIEEVSNAREGLLEVCANNLTKYVQVFDPKANEIIQQTIEQYASQGIKVTVELNNTFGVYLFKDENGKIRKPSSYRNVDLISYLGGTNV